MRERAHAHPLARPAAGLILAAAGWAQEPPSTVPEATDHARTSTHAQVAAFIQALDGLPHAQRLRVGSIGRSHEGRDLLVVAVGEPVPRTLEAARAGERLRVLVNANIHGGEVEGKEAVQMLLREFALGQHAELLERTVIAFVPVYNPDGNDRIERGNRVSQNGPDGGVGERHNAQGLDLNRDFVKAESPECQALLGLMNAWDPHLFMDLHTTNGSAHGYHLTYSPSLSTNVDAELDRFTRQAFLTAVRRHVRERHGFRVFDYGNFDRERSQWSTYDHRPRYGTNYVGLRNRIGVLSEAYSCLPFHERIAVTRAFVLETLRAAASRCGAIQALCEGCDRRTRGRDDSVVFGWDSELAQGRPAEVLVGSVSSVEIEGLGRRRVADAAWHAESMLVRDAFVSRTSVALPSGWALLEPPESPGAATTALRQHGLAVLRLSAALEVEVRLFEPSEVRRRSFRGLEQIGLTGEWRSERRTLPVDTLVIDAAQPLARVAAQLLEPSSEDSLSTWGFFEAQTRAATQDQPGAYPVLRIVGEFEPQGQLLPAHRVSGF